jgi:3-deoxy-manno-octulosonate cytidylyltransferase (CMP-KDO synthetase)
MRKQICVVPFRRGFLLEYTRMPPTPLEMIESVDMMRILENGLKVRMVLTKYDTKSVDTKEDLAIVEKIMAHDRLFKIYENRRYSKKVAG